MNKALDKIWVDLDVIHKYANSDGDIEYIRTDIVNELAEALEGLIENTAPICEDSYSPEVEDSYDKARAALAKARGTQ